MLPDQQAAIAIAGQPEAAIPDDEKIDEPAQAVQGGRIYRGTYQTSAFDQLLLLL
ncbi:MAG TPA: hypothetical protein VKD88_01155 [Gaiellaceae bacterium]|nr:hypothetical protein [Gaiellaceae bacterium]